MLKSPDPDFCPFSNHLPASFLNIFENISDLKVICAQSWGHLEANGEKLDIFRFNHVSSRAHGLRSHIDSSDLLIHGPISHKMFDRWLYHLNVLVVVKRNCHFRVKFQYKSKFSIII